MKNRFPRKLKKQIPKGMYCYKPTSGFKQFKDGSYGYSIKPCNFLSYIKIKDIPIESRPQWMDDDFVNKYGEDTESWCKLIKTDVLDQCKSCGIKE